MATPTVYVICDQNCKFEGMTKEQILTAIAQAVETGEIKDVDAGFVQTIKTINGKPLKFFVGEQSAYDKLTDEEKKNLFAIITNETTREDILDAIITLKKEVKELSEKLFLPFAISETKKLEKAGFYMFLFRLLTLDSYSCSGVFYWDGVSILTQIIDSTTRFTVSANGEISVLSSAGGAENVTDLYSISISKIWG